MRILVTGGAGFVGSHVTGYHIEKGDEVLVMDDLSTGSRENIASFMKNPRFRFDEADIRTWPSLERAMAWADRVYHMAAVVGVHRVLEEPLNVITTNTMGSERLLEAARRNYRGQQIVLPSSSEVYGHGPNHRNARSKRIGLNALRRNGEFREDMKLTIEGFNASFRSNYPISKLALEALGLSYATESGMNIVIIRLFNTVGPRQTGRYGMVVPRFVKQAVRGDPVIVYGDGSQSRCFCDVRDAVVFFDLLAGNPASAGEIVNVGHSREISIQDLAMLVNKRSASDSPIKHISRAEAYGVRFEETHHRRPSLKKLFKFTGFKHTWTLERTLDDLIGRERACLKAGKVEAKWQQSRYS